MGFNISGLAINKNYESDFHNLQNQLGWKLEKLAEIDFEKASSNWKEDGLCDVYFSEKGTLLFISIDRCTQSYPLKQDNTLTFALSEISMAFNMNYCEHGNEKRSIMQVDENRLQDEGERLDVEDTSEEVSEIIWNQLEVVLGKSFWTIEPDEKATRYKFYTSKPHYTTDQITDINQTGSEEGLVNNFSLDGLFQQLDEIKESISTNSPKKKWWQFWK